jgi:hypothetical protein
MNDEILNDFFSFASDDKKVITAKDLENVEKFLNKSEFDDICEQFVEFLNDFVYWCIKKLELQINVIDEGQINKIVLIHYMIYF